MFLCMAFQHFLPTVRYSKEPELWNTSNYDTNHTNIGFSELSEGQEELTKASAQEHHKMSLSFGQFATLTSEDTSTWFEKRFSHPSQQSNVNPIKNTWNLAKYALMKNYTNRNWQQRQKLPSICIFLTIFTVSTSKAQGTEANVGIGFARRAGATIDARGFITDPTAALP